MITFSTACHLPSVHALHNIQPATVAVMACSEQLTAPACRKGSAGLQLPELQCTTVPQHRMSSYVVKPRRKCRNKHPATFSGWMVVQNRQSFAEELSESHKAIVTWAPPEASACMLWGGDELRAQRPKSNGQTDRLCRYVGTLKTLFQSRVGRVCC
jgi:hypothetical protein